MAIGDRVQNYKCANKIDDIFDHVNSSKNASDGTVIVAVLVSEVATTKPNSKVLLFKKIN